MASRTTILLPPSEGKALGGTGEPWEAGVSTLPELDPWREVLWTHLTDRGDGLEQSAPTMRAIDRYSGVLYKELDAATLPAASLRRLERQALVISGLWGAVAPSDPIPWYTLKMSARIEPFGRLSRWWRPDLTQALRPRIDRAVVWDLLPNEHSDAVDWGLLAPRRRITVRFVAANGSTVSHWNKLLKGSLVRWLAETGASVEDLDAFDHPQGYRLDPLASVFSPREAAVVLRESS